MTSRRSLLRLAALGFTALLLLPPAHARAETLLVFAAQSLAEAMAQVAGRFTDETGIEVQISLGASSTMARQIEARAPANVFLSANRQWADYLLEREALVPETVAEVAGNELVLIAPNADGDTAVSSDLSDLPAIVATGRIAVGNPAHVPAGIYAEAALRHLALWDPLADRLAPAANVRAALRFVEQGAAEFGIVYRTDAAASSRVRILGSFPPDSHPPIVYPAAVVAENDTPAARSFVEFLQSASAADVLRRHGFSIPAEASR